MAGYVWTDELIHVTPDRLKEVGGAHEVEVWTGYKFSGRNDKYSSFKYHWHHFTGTDWEAQLESNNDIYRFLGSGKPGWAKDVDDSFGNYDYLCVLTSFDDPCGPY